MLVFIFRPSQTIDFRQLSYRKIYRFGLDDGFSQKQIDVVWDYLRIDRVRAILVTSLLRSEL
jgi:hypothetical protein